MRLRNKTKIKLVFFSGVKFIGKNLASCLLAILIVQISLQFSIAANYSDDLNEFISLEIKPLANSDIVIDNLKKMNEQHASLSDANITGLQATWISEIRKVSRPLMSEILDNDLAKFLHKILEAGKGVYTEIRVIERKGLSIAQTSVGHDYSNIGKPIWQKTFGINSYAPYISEIYFNDDTGKFQVDVALMIVLDDNPVGLILAGIDTEQLADWKKRRK